MTDPSWREYANSLYEAYHRLVIRPGSSRLDLTIAERIMEGLAASLARAGWPDEEGVAEDTLGLLYRFVMLTYRLPDGMRAAVDEFLGRNPRPRLHRQTRERWRGALATLA
jgi:hypothetical protein